MGRVKRLLPYLAWAGLAASLAGAAAFGFAWQQAREANLAIADGSLIERKDLDDSALLRYAAAWLHERAGRIEPALEHYAAAEGARNPQLAARSKFGMGNLYFRTGLQAGNVATGGSHVQGLAQFELAREAYRGALRIAPELREARYNLELLERLSPQRRVQGWMREEEGVRLEQHEEQGWAAMKEGSVIRGLP